MSMIDRYLKQEFAKVKAAQRAVEEARYQEQCHIDPLHDRIMEMWAAPQSPRVRLTGGVVSQLATMGSIAGRSIEIQDRLVAEVHDAVQVVVRSEVLSVQQRKALAAWYVRRHDPKQGARYVGVSERGLKPMVAESVKLVMKSISPVLHGKVNRGINQLNSISASPA